jgi:hypothetical protein
MSGRANSALRLAGGAGLAAGLFFVLVRWGMWPDLWRIAVATVVATTAGALLTANSRDAVYILPCLLTAIAMLVVIVTLDRSRYDLSLHLLAIWAFGTPMMFTGALAGDAVRRAGPWVRRRFFMRL